MTGASPALRSLLPVCLLLLLAGCPDDDDDSGADDDDSGAAGDDDDSSDDDDSAAPDDDDDDSAPDDDDDSAPSFDLSDPAVVVERFFHTVEIRFALHTHRLGSAAGDGDCPEVVGEDPEVLTGDCSAADLDFEGTLERTTTVLPEGGLRIDYAGTDWRVHGPGGLFGAVGLDGTGQAETQGDETAGVGDWRLEGRIEYEPLGPAAGLLPPVVIGEHTFHVEWGPDSPDRHVFTADLVVPGTGRYTADLLLDKVAGPCDAYAAGSYARIDAAGRTAELDLAADPDPCDFCFPWRLDGEPQPEPACIELR